MALREKSVFQPPEFHRSARPFSSSDNGTNWTSGTTGAGSGSALDFDFDVVARVRVGSLSAAALVA